MSFRKLCVVSLAIPLLAACNSPNTSPAESLGTVSQRATGDTDLTLRATSTTPAGGTATTLSADAPVTAASAVLSQTLEGNWNNGALQIATTPTYPQGWALDYYAGATKLATAPTTATQWASVTRILTTGSYETVGSSSGSQVWLNHATAAPPVIASSFSGGSLGDGWDVFFDANYTKVFNIHHHNGPATVMCRDLRTSAACPGFPVTLTQTADRSTGHIDAISNRLWQPTVTTGSRAAWDCVDLTTAARCTGTNPVVSGIAVVGTAYNNHIEPVVIGRKMYAIASSATNATISCLDMSTGAECTAINPALGTFSMVDGITAIGANLYFRINAKLDCFDTVANARCAGTWPQAMAATRPVRGIPGTDGVIANVCADYQCVSLTGSAHTLPVEFINYANANRTGGFSSYYYSNSHSRSTRIVWGTGSQRIACFDMATKASCGSAWPIFVSRVYSAKVDPLNTNCIWTNGDDGIIRNFDVVTGTQGCTSPPPIITFQGSGAVPRLACDAGNRVGNWQQFKLTNPTPTEYTSATLTIRDSSGSNIPGWSNLPIPANSTVDLTSLTTVQTGQTPTFDIVPVGLTDLTTPTADFKILGPAPQLCWNLTPPSNCGGTSSVVAKGSLTLPGGTTNYTDQTLAINSGTAGATGCTVAIAPAYPTKAPRASQAFTATGGSALNRVWSLATNASGGSITAAGVYTAGATGSVTDVVKVVDSLGLSATTNVTVSAGVTVTPASITLTSGGTRTFTAAGGSGTGFTWAFQTNTSGATLNAGSGLYTAGATPGGLDVVRATDSLGNVATADVTVAFPLDISPSSATAPPRGAQAFSATGGTGGNLFTLTTNNSGGSVTGAGAYTAGATGGVNDVVTVTDSAGHVSAATIAVSAGVSISPAAAISAPLDSVSLSATGGSGTGYSWTVSTNNSGGSVSSSGLFTAGLIGSVLDTVTVTDSLGNTATRNVGITPGVTVTPAAPSTPPRGVVTFAAMGGSSAGYSWAVTTNNSGAAIDAAGSYTAGSTPGVTDTVTVTDSLGNTAARNVSVGGGVTVTPVAPSTPPNGSIVFAATGGSGTGFTWSVTTNASGASVDASGRYTAGSTGAVTDVVTVTDSLGNPTTVSVTVGSAITINPASANTPPRGLVGLSATGGSGTGYTWTLSTNASGGSIDTGTGAYTAGSAGNLTDVASVTDSLGNTAAVSIRVGAEITISPPLAAVAPRDNALFLATGGNGGPYTWSLSANRSGGSIDAAGAYAAGPTGSVVDTVQVVDALGNVGSVNISVGDVIAINPSSPAVSPREALTFSAIGGAGAPFTFSLGTNLSGAVIDASGNYVAGSTGSVTDVVSVTDRLGNSASVNVVVGPRITVTAEGGSTSTPPSGTIQFDVAGGSGSGYTWSVPTNASGAMVASGGLYTAGATGAVSDVLRVTDSLGNTAVVTITVTPGLSITPVSPSSPPNGVVALQGAGGSGTGYSWTFASNASGGTIDATGQYHSGRAGNVSDTIRLTDSLGNIASVTIAVGAELVIAPASASVSPLGPRTFTVTGGSGTGYVWSLPTSASGGVIDATGSYVAGATAAVVDIVQVVDSLGNVATANISVGGALAANPAAPVVAPREAVTFTASGGDGTAQWTLSSNLSGGSIDATGAYRAGNRGGVIDVVTLTDGLGNTTSVNVTVGPGLSLTPPNLTTPPRGSEVFSVAGGSGSGYVWSLATRPSGGVIDATGSYTAGSTGGVTDEVKVTDSLGNTATAQVTVKAGVSITPAAPTTAPRGSVSFTATGGSSTYTWRILTSGSQGSVSSAGLYTAGSVGNVTDTVEVTDSLGNTARVSIVVSAGLAITPSSPAAPPLGALQFVASGGSAAGYTWRISVNDSGGTIGATTGAYVAGPAGGVTDTIELRDSLGNSLELSVSVGGALALNPSAPQVAPRGSISFVTAGGAGGPITFRLATNASGGTIDAAGAYVAGANGNVTDVVEATDALGNVTTVNVRVGSGLSFALDNVNVPPRGKATMAITGGSGSGYVWELATNASGATLNNGAYQAGATPDVADVVRVTDSVGNTTTATIHVGAGITLAPTDITVVAGDTAGFTATGGQGADYVFTLSASPSGGTINPTSGRYEAGDVGDATDLVLVTDPLGNTATATVHVAPRPVSDAGVDGAARDGGVRDGSIDAPAAPRKDTVIAGGGCDCTVGHAGSLESVTPWLGALTLAGVMAARRRRRTNGS